MHRVDQHRDVAGIDVGRDAVAEVEHMAGMRAELRLDPRDLAPDHLG
jgi:hypothetical protein